MNNQHISLFSYLSPETRQLEVAVIFLTATKQFSTFDKIQIKTYRPTKNLRHSSLNKNKIIMYVFF